MYCTNCQCDFVGWMGKCPDCGTALVDGKAPEPEAAAPALAYEDLVALVRRSGDRLVVPLGTSEVGMQRGLGFPYRAYKFAWASAMQGDFDSSRVVLTTTEVGKEKKWKFPYFGYGYAWVKHMQGHIGGNEVTLSASRVARERKYGFPYRGFGFAWTEEMSGKCGAQIDAKLVVTDVGKKKGWGFPFSGYGAAWERKADLVLSLAN